MFEKVKDKFSEFMEDNQRKREARERIAKEQDEEKARLEREQIQAKKNALMALTEKELMVEAVMALRGYNTRLNHIEESHAELVDRFSYLETKVITLENNTSD